MDKRIGHGKGLMWANNSSISRGYGGGSGVGHGFRAVMLERAGISSTVRFSSSPAYEMNKSIGYAFGHGRCFIRSPQAFVDPTLADHNIERLIAADINNSSDSSNNNSTSSDEHDGQERRRAGAGRGLLANHNHFNNNNNNDDHSDSDDDDDRDDDNSITSSHPDSGIGL